MDDTTRKDVLRRLAYIEGHLSGAANGGAGHVLRGCAQADLRHPSGDRKMETKMLAGHLHHCVVDGISGGDSARVLDELVELYALANK